MHCLLNCFKYFQLKRFLVRNRKDRKTRRKKGKNGAVEEDITPQSDKASSVFRPLSSAFGPKGSKISRLGDAGRTDTAIKAEPGASFANGANSNYVFQPEEFQNLLDSATLGKPRNFRIAFIILNTFFHIFIV